MLSQTPKSKLALEIIPEERFLVFHGDQHNAEPVKLRGVVRLDAPEATSIKGVKIVLEGKRRIGWYYTGGVSTGEIQHKKTFLREHRSLGTSGNHKVRAGVMEWPFEFTIQPDAPESVEGFNNTWIVYNLHADIERPGWNTKNLHAHAHIRLVRTLGASEMESTRSRTNADIWANKVSYNISIPSDAVVFGTSIIADFELSPLRKGVTLGKVEMRLTENIVKRISAADNPDWRDDRFKTDEIEVARHEMPFPEDSRVTFEDEDEANPTMEDERYHFKAKLDLPKSLRECRQDVDMHSIQIAHKLKLMINIHNPEGHTSQLVCRLPVKLFISPNLPVDDRQEVQALAVNPMSDQELNQGTSVNAPPVYGQHQLDELYSDITLSGFHTRLPSGSATPAGLLSRVGSSENLRSLTTETENGQINSALLQSRLQSLQQERPHATFNLPSSQGANGHASSHNHSANHTTRSTPASHTPHSVNALSRFPSNESPPPDPPQLSTSSYDMDNLSRIPSYTTALRQPGAVTPFSDGPPTYFEAMSRPSSPGHTPTSPPITAPPPIRNMSMNNLSSLTAHHREPAAQHHREGPIRNLSLSNLAGALRNSSLSLHHHHHHHATSPPSAAALARNGALGHASPLGHEREHTPSAAAPGTRGDDGDGDARSGLLHGRG